MPCSMASHRIWSSVSGSASISQKRLAMAKLAALSLRRSSLTSWRRHWKTHRQCRSEFRQVSGWFPSTTIRAACRHPVRARLLLKRSVQALSRAPYSMIRLDFRSPAIRAPARRAEISQIRMPRDLIISAAMTRKTLLMKVSAAFIDAPSGFVHRNG